MLKSLRPLLKYYLPSALLFSASASGLTYTVKRGDTLSQLVHSRLGGRVWGKKGGLQATLERNPGILDPNRIFPGQVIVLDDDAMARMPEDEFIPEAIEADERMPASTDSIPAMTSEDTETPSRFRLSPRLGYSQIRGLDPRTRTRGEFNSGLNYGLEGTWGQSWTERFGTAIVANLQKERYDANQLTTVSVTGNQPTLSRLDLEAVYSASRYFDLKGSIGTGHELWYHANALTNLEMDKVLVSDAKATLIFHAARIKRYQVDLIAGYRHLFGANSGVYDLSAGRGYTFGVDLHETLRSGSVFGCGARYSGYSQDSSIVLIERRDIDLRCGFEWNW